MRLCPRKKYLHYLSAATVLITIAATLPSSPASAQPQVTATIGAWNIQWLGSPDERPSYAANIAQKAEDIAAYIVASKVDILGLEEITDNDNQPTKFTNLTLDKAFALIKTNHGQDWTYVLFPKGAGQNTQLLGLAWNKTRVTGPFEQWEIPLDYSPASDEVWRRKPYAVKLSFGAGKTDLVVVVVHMKSGLPVAQTGCDNECVKCARSTEAYLLASKLDELRTKFQDDDIVILGDTNVLRAEKSAVRHFTLAGFKDLNASERETHFDGQPLDRIFVKANQAEFVNSSFTVFKDEYLQSAHLSTNNFRKFYSDHYLVKTSFLVKDDDD